MRDRGFGDGRSTRRGRRRRRWCGLLCRQYCEQPKAHSSGAEGNGSDAFHSKVPKRTKGSGAEANSASYSICEEYTPNLGGTWMGQEGITSGDICRQFRPEIAKTGV